MGKSLGNELGSTVTAILKGPFEEARCKQACPLGIDVPRYIRLIGQGKFDDALAVVREKAPFPAILGRVCFHPCEAKCRRGEIDDPVAISALKRFASEHSLTASVGTAATTTATGRRVAVVGSGPAGLTAAYYLARRGHAVTVFEALPEAGGMMRVGIPEYRLPRGVLDQEIEAIRRAGVDIKTGVAVDSPGSLFEQGFAAVFVALGAHRGTKMGVPGEDSAGVVECVSFLREANLGKGVKLGNRVVVVGGGNAAVDASRTALRLGATEVTILYRRSREHMPADAAGVAEAAREGVNLELLAAPAKITRKDGALRLECIRMKLGAPDESGRPRPEPVAGSEFGLEADTVISAIGQVPEIPGQFGLATTDQSLLRVDPDTLATSKAGVFAGGDAVTGPASVVEAVAAGRKAAVSIDRYLGGSGVLDETLAPAEGAVSWLGFEESCLDYERAEMPSLVTADRLSGFAEVDLGLAPEMAAREAERCLRCDLGVPITIDRAKCVECTLCQLICSLMYQQACNPEKARIVIFPPQEISYTEECVGGCALCAQYCPAHAISVEEG